MVEHLPFSTVTSRRGQSIALAIFSASTQPTVGQVTSVTCVPVRTGRTQFRHVGARLAIMARWTRHLIGYRSTTFTIETRPTRASGFSHGQFITIFS